MNNSIRSIASACILATASTLVFAQNPLSNTAYGTAKGEIKAAYKTEKETCRSKAGNARDICNQQAESGEKVALAHLDWQRSGSADDQRKMNEARVEARYEVAKEKCDDLAGNGKSVCQAEATAARDKAKADMKMKKEVAEARSEAEEARSKADYKLASERCDALAGDAKDSCVATAKARHGM